MARAFGLGAALDVWRDEIPDRGERIAYLRSQLYDCESTRPVGNSRSGTKEARDVYTDTAHNLRLMLTAEGAQL